MTDRSKLLEKKIREMAQECDFNLYENYSGRGMYGATCLGVTHESAEAVIEEAASRGIRGAHVDRMGRGVIVYWPSTAGR